MNDWPFPDEDNESLRSKQVQPFDAGGSTIGFPSLVGHRIGRFHISRKIGSGGASTVYQAYDAVDAHSVALKVMLPGSDEIARRRFQHETVIASRLTHPNIVKTFQVGNFAEFNVGYIAMELVYGDTLEGLLKKVPQLNFAEACCLLGPVARALAYAHRENLVHRDVKPSNVLIRPSSLHDEHHIQIASLDYPFVPLLSDFGIAWAIDMPELTATGRTVGSPSYMSPEQCSGSGPADARTDIYALGAVLYRCIVGKNLFLGSTSEILYKQVHVDFEADNPALEQVSLPGELRLLLRRCLAKDPDGRIQSATELAQELEAIGASTEVGPRGFSPQFRDIDTQTMPYLDTSPKLEEQDADRLPNPDISKPQSLGKLQILTVSTGALVLLATVVFLILSQVNNATRPNWNFLNSNQSRESTQIANSTPTAGLQNPENELSVVATPPLPQIAAVPMLPSGTPTEVPFAIVIPPEGINVRAGPGIEYPVLLMRVQEDRLEITGVDQSGNWWEVDLSQSLHAVGARGWVSGTVVSAHNVQQVLPVSLVSPTPNPTATSTPIPTATPTLTATPTASPTFTPTPLAFYDVCRDFGLYRPFRDLFENFGAYEHFGCQSSAVLTDDMFLQEYRWGTLIYMRNSNRVYAGQVKDDRTNRRKTQEGALISFFRYPAWDFFFAIPDNMKPVLEDDTYGDVDPTDFFEPFLLLLDHRTASDQLSLRSRLGPPLATTQRVQGSIQQFEKGIMILVEEEEQKPFILQFGKLERSDFQ